MTQVESVPPRAQPESLSASESAEPATLYDVVVVGGGPAGATAASELAKNGRSVVLLDRAGRIKPCGGAVPPRLIRDFAIPNHLLKARITKARMISPSDRGVDMPIEGGYVGMVDRCEFDEWLRERAANDGAERRTGTFEAFERAEDGTAIVSYRPGGETAGKELRRLRARLVIAADGARSQVAKQAGIPNAERVPCVFAYHEIVASPDRESESFESDRCDVYYQGKLSPDFYAWVFPHGNSTSIGVGSANKGFSLRGAVSTLRNSTGMSENRTIRREGAPIPLKPLKRWDNGRDVIAAGDAAGIVAPASGEGIYYAMLGGQLSAQAAERALDTGDARQLASARKQFMRAHGRVFWILGIMQKFWYSSDRRRERFVSICQDPDVQYLTWQAYMEKKLVKARPGAHLRIFLKDMAHLLRVVSP
ncbi:geranylgeranyl diphosphate reductase [Algihabitans sp.]|uniref:geranylgeranyl diphosphate reductase n=1 Tax=Algihabitans sp. TaxID=2821514 RepID=UPI003BA901D7